ncbi:hypothetical protein SmJEL517_g01039 [Synchytrium microbalum]|uniref:PIH1 domain-containing protein 1 n=1 Tax=Synchytrium microbalum TaxID=1806994 RepID=A0A507CCS8_9FUNG|nr:uncharacterized protein SmJEL517_g01039 [Synchytrium microbalum]TPX37148.1 hypothetical protein SmJEL517_g01039 [Synchytrium microbalum]
MVNEPTEDADLRALLESMEKSGDPSPGLPLAAEHAEQFVELMAKIAQNPELASSLSAESMPSTLKVNASSDTQKERHEVTPQPGFVLKTVNRKKSASGEWAEGIKVFINFGHSSQIPSPPPGSDEEILKAIATEDGTYKVPTSLSTPRRDKDKAGREACVYDVCVHTNALQLASRLEDYQIFLMELVLQHVETKSGMLLSRDISFPKMKSKGPLAKHIIYRAKRPSIAETAPIISNKPDAPSKAPAKPKKLPAPEYEVIPTPKTGRPEYIQVKIRLPAVESTKEATLDVELDKLILSVPNLHDADIKLPWKVDIDSCRAQFDRSVRHLNVYLTCSK